MCRKANDHNPKETTISHHSQLLRKSISLPDIPQNLNIRPFCKTSYIILFSKDGLLGL